MLILVAVLAACAGKAPPNPDNTDGSTGDGGDTTAQPMTGKAMDYFGGVALQDTTITSDGIDPPVMATSAADGTYSMDIAVGSKFYVTAAHANYRTTRNPAVAIADMPITDDVYVMSEQDVKNQYTVLGKTPTAGTAFFTADLLRNNGDPLVDIPLTAITLVDANNQPVPNVIGPYFYGSAGVVDPALTTATAYGTPPKSRVAFFDVPPGTFTLRVVYQNGMGQEMTVDTTFSAAADGATLAAMATMSGGGGGMGSGSGSGMGSGSGTPTDPKFATDIYPRLQKAANGGLGCANCHTANGPGAVLKFDDAPDIVLANMKAITGVIDLVTPANSLVLTNPLYEPPPTPQNHPNATFLDINDPDYKLILLWITKGAL